MATQIALTQVPTHFSLLDSVSPHYQMQHKPQTLFLVCPTNQQLYPKYHLCGHVDELALWVEIGPLEQQAFGEALLGVTTTQVQVPCNCEQ